MIQEGRIQPGAQITVLHDTCTTTTLDGNWGFGQVVARAVAQTAIAKAHSAGLAVVTVQHCNHVGRLADFAILAAQEDMIGFMAASGHGGGMRVSAWGGRGPSLHTNPLCVAVPAHGCPLVLDMATSVVAEGKVRLAKYRGRDVPQGWLTDASGQQTVDPQVLYQQPPGALLPLGGVAGYKGFGLSLIVDILAGALSGAGCSGSNPSARGNALFFLVINISHFLQVADFKVSASALIAHVKHSQSLGGYSEITIPGEPEQNNRSRYLRSGIPLSVQLWKRLRALTLDEQYTGRSLYEIRKGV